MKISYTKFLVAGAVTGWIVLVFLIFCGTTRPLGGGDQFWQVRTGNIILETGNIPDKDVFSYTIAGKHWNNHEWLYEVLLSLLYQAAGWGGLRIMVFVLFGGFVITAGLYHSKQFGPYFGFAAASLFAFISSYKMIAAPQTVSMLIFLCASLTFFRKDLLKSRLRFASLCLLMLLWGNLTAESLMFLPFLIADQLTRTVAESRSRLQIRRAIIYLLLPCACTLISPTSSSVPEYALLGGKQFNVEFLPIWVPAGSIPPMLKFCCRALIVLYVAWIIIFWKSLCKERLFWNQVTLGLLAVTGAILYERNYFLLFLPLGHWLQATYVWAHKKNCIAVSHWCMVFLGFFGIFLFAGTYGWNVTKGLQYICNPKTYQRHIDPRTNPVSCYPALQQLPANAHVLTPRLWASYVIMHAPHVLVFYDGRLREYPPEIHYAAEIMLNGEPGALDLLSATKTEWVLTKAAWGSLPEIQKSSCYAYWDCGSTVLYHCPDSMDLPEPQLP